MRAVIYCRVSTERQAKENDSLPYQRKACIEYCRTRGWEVAEVFMEEGESAKTIDRPEFNRMIEYCRRNKRTVDVAVVYALSRFSRDTLDHKTVRALLSSYGVTLRSVSEPIDESPEGEFMEHMVSGVAQYENRQRARRTVAGMKNKLENGGWPFKTPLGYRNTMTAGGHKKIVPDPERANLICHAFDMYGTGLHTKLAVLKEITLRGLRTLGGKPLSPQTFDRTLRNPLYAGYVGVAGWEVSQVGTHEAIICKDVFDRVQSLLSGRRVSVTPHRRNNPDFSLRHFVRCGYCNRPLTGSWARGRKDRYPYYHCPNRGCDRKVSIRKEKLELLFFEYLKTLQPGTEYMQLFRAVVMDVWKKKQSDSAVLRNAVERKMNDLKARKVKLMQARFYDENISQEDYSELKSRLDTDLALVEIEEREVRSSELDAETAINYAENIFTDAARMWSEMSADQKQRFQQVIFPEGIAFADGHFRTDVTCLLFGGLGHRSVEKAELVAIPGFAEVNPRKANKNRGNLLFAATCL